MNGEWYTTPKCTVAETVGHRIVLTSKFKNMARTVEKGRSAETGKFVSIEYAQKHPSTTVVEKVKVGPTKHRK
jgi:hypothetical protein